MKRFHISRYKHCQLTSEPTKQTKKQIRSLITQFEWQSGRQSVRPAASSGDVWNRVDNESALITRMGHFIGSRLFTPHRPTYDNDPALDAGQYSCKFLEQWLIIWFSKCCNKDSFRGSVVNMYNWRGRDDPKTFAKPAKKYKEERSPRGSNKFGGIRSRPASDPLRM